MLKKAILFLTVLFSFLAVNGQVNGIDLNSLSPDDLINLGISNTDLRALQQGAQSNNSGGDEVSPVDTSLLEEVQQQQEFVLESVKEVDTTKVKKFGHSVFTSGAVNIQMNSDRIYAPDNYVLGTGDRLSVTIWGSSEYSSEYILDEFGNITPRLVGQINLKGKNFITAKKIITKRFGNVYDLKNSQIAINLSYSKVVAVNIVGEVESPGTYTIPGINSAFNVLSLAGGPKLNANVRDIKIIRNGMEVKSLDVYAFLAKPTFKSTYLQDGDFIVVSRNVEYLETLGEVVRPGKYEFKAGETIADLILYSGGFAEGANKKLFHVERLGLDGYYQFDSKEDTVTLKAGDKITVDALPTLRHGVVSITGKVNNAGSYKFIDGETLYDLIERCGGINYETKEGVGHLYRRQESLESEIIVFNPNDSLGLKSLEIKEFDEVKLFSKRDYMDDQSVQVLGYVRNPGNLNFHEGMTLEDAIVLSNGMRPEAETNKIQVERLSFVTNDQRVYTNKIELDFASSKNFKLQPFDIIIIRKLPQFTYQEKVFVQGEVDYPGEYSISDSIVTLKDMIAICGGVTPWADIEGARLFRTEDNKGWLLMNLKEVLKKKNSPFNYIVKPNDTIVIPKLTNIVTIEGGFGYKKILEMDRVNSPFIKGKRAKYYIKEFGAGFDTKSKRFHVYTEGRNGLVRNSRFLGLISPKVINGDRIVILYRKSKFKDPNAPGVDWNFQIENITLKLTGIATLWALVNNL